MVQREFWTERYPVEIEWRYRYEPTKPETGQMLTMTVRDQARLMMEVATVQVDAEVLDEAVPALIEASWMGYLYGDRLDAARAFNRSGAQWRKLARKRRASWHAPKQ